MKTATFLIITIGISFIAFCSWFVLNSFILLSKITIFFARVKQCFKTPGNVEVSLVLGFVLLILLIGIAIGLRLSHDFNSFQFNHLLAN